MCGAVSPCVRTSLGSRAEDRMHPRDPSRFAIVPFHGKMATGILRSLLRSTRVSLEEFLKVFGIL